MFGITRLVSTRLGFQLFRSFSSLKNPVPTVFEPLAPKRNGQAVIPFLQQQLLKKYDPTGKRRALVDPKTGLKAGDIIKVTYLDRTDVIGRVIAIKRAVNSVGTNILIRNKINRVGCEVRIPLYSPNLKNIELISKPKQYLSRNKQYYIRNTKLDVDDLEAFIKRQHKKSEKKLEKAGKN